MLSKLKGSKVSKLLGEGYDKEVRWNLSVLLELMKEGVRFRSSGVFTKHVIKQLARKIRRNVQEPKK